MRCLTRRNWRQWHCAPTFPQADEGFRKFKEIFPANEIETKENPREIYFPRTRSLVQFRVTANKAYEHWRSAGLDGITFDEAGSCPEEAYLTARPMLVDSQDPLTILIGSPRGRNWFYRSWIKGHDRASGWWSNPFPWPSLLRPSFPRSEWEAMKRDMPTMWFDQECRAEFLQNVLGAFRNPVASDHEYLPLKALAKWPKKLGMGADFARTQDFTVIMVMDEDGKILYRERFQLKKWSHVVERCKVIWYAAGCPQFAVDATGLGDVVYEMLVAAGINAGALIPFKFTNESKAKLYLTGQKRNEQGKILVPKSDSYGLSEFDACEVHTNSNGVLKFGAPDGLHDDYVTAAMLANYVLAQHDRFNIGAFKMYQYAT